MYKHEKDSDVMHPLDRIVVIKLYDFLHPVPCRLRLFVNEGRFTKPAYAYVHGADGAILQRYTYGYDILEEVNL